eukprot:scaffold60827_cov35-Prasinocladus_malaysianus.AAC.1
MASQPGNARKSSMVSSTHRRAQLVDGGRAGRTLYDERNAPGDQDWVDVKRTRLVKGQTLYVSVDKDLALEKFEPP